MYSELVVQGRTVAATFQLSDADLAATLAIDKERKVDRAEVLAGSGKLFDYLARHVTVTNVQFPCKPEPRGLELADKADGFFAVARLDYQCKRTAADVVVRYDVFFDVDPRHQGFARVRVGSEAEREHVFRTQDRVRDYLYLGVEHIFTGYDHLAFLFGLLIVAGFQTLRGGLRYVLGVVTAFTVAHSLTLICAGLDWVRLPARFVEPAIALSIFYVAVENLMVNKPRHRWLLTFGFGLVHGFGFASVLREIGLPPRGLVLSLLSFNVGVELGQLSIVALVSPALYLFTRSTWRAGNRGGLAWLAALAAGAFGLLHHFGLPTAQLAVVVFGVPLALVLVVPRFGYDRAVRLAGSLILAGLAAFWFLERILEKSWLAGALG